MFFDIEVNQEITFNIGYCLVVIGTSYNGNIGVYALGLNTHQIFESKDIAIINSLDEIEAGMINLIQVGEYNFKLINKDYTMRSVSVGIIRTR